MKIQCACGTKYNIEVTPEMGRQRVHFVCSVCGVDASEYVTRAVRQELGLPEASAVPVAMALPLAQPAAAPVAAPFVPCIAPPPPGYAAPAPTPATYTAPAPAIAV